MKKKIALLSFHNAANYGAALQAYALQEALVKKGYDCEYINYQNEYRRNAYNMTYQIIDNLKKGKLKSALIYFLGSPFMYIRKIRFGRFYRQYLRCTDKVYISSESVTRLNAVYDKFIVGGDQVWNYENNGGDFAYLLDFVLDDKKKISYSSSFGLHSIPKAMVDEYRSCLNHIQYLSVRESYGLEIIKGLTGREARLVLDPVFLIEKENWVSLSRTIKDKYVFSYTNQVQQFNQFLTQTNFDITPYKHYKLARATYVSDFLSNRTKVKYTMSPLEFVSVIHNAELIVSASFHCISLSIILNKPFVAILSGDSGKDERICSILTLLGLQDRILSTSMTLENVMEAIDYDDVNEKIALLRGDSFRFLVNSIED